MEAEHNNEEGLTNNDPSPNKKRERTEEDVTNTSPDATLSPQDRWGYGNASKRPRAKGVDLILLLFSHKYSVMFITTVGFTSTGIPKWSPVYNASTGTEVSIWVIVVCVRCIYN